MHRLCYLRAPNLKKCTLSVYRNCPKFRKALNLNDQSSNGARRRLAIAKHYDALGHSLSKRDVEILFECEDQDLTVKQLTTKLPWSQRAIAGSVAELVKKGLLIPSPFKDNRARSYVTSINTKDIHGEGFSALEIKFIGENVPLARVITGLASLPKVELAVRYSYRDAIYYLWYRSWCKKNNIPLPNGPTPSEVKAFLFQANETLKEFINLYPQIREMPIFGFNDITHELIGSVPHKLDEETVETVAVDFITRWEDKIYSVKGVDYKQATTNLELINKEREYEQ